MTDMNNHLENYSSLQLDRSIVQVLIAPTATSSSSETNVYDTTVRGCHKNNNVGSNNSTSTGNNLCTSTNKEHVLYTLHGTYIIWSAAKILKLSDNVYATATVLFHRYYYYSHCLQENTSIDVWSIALGSMLLAIKIIEPQQQQQQKDNDNENGDGNNSNSATTTNDNKPEYNRHEPIIKVRQLILAFVHIYRRHAYILLDENNDNDNDNDGTSSNNDSNNTNSENISINENTRNETKNVQIQNQQQQQLLYEIIYNHPQVAYPQFIKTITTPPTMNTLLVERTKKTKQLLKETFPRLLKYGPLYNEWHKSCIESENLILRRLGYTIYWIPKHHCHLFLMNFIMESNTIQINVLDNNDDNENHANDNMFINTINTSSNNHNNNNNSKGSMNRLLLLQQSWKCCNVSYRLNLCIRYKSEIISCAAIYVASLELNMKLSSVSSTSTVHHHSSSTVSSWWDVFCGPGHDQDISDCAQSILYVINGSKVPKTINSNSFQSNNNNYLDVFVASKAFLKSKNHSTDTISFNDPGSYIWECMIENNNNSMD